MGSGTDTWATSKMPSQGRRAAMRSWFPRTKNRRRPCRRRNTDRACALLQRYAKSPRCQTVSSGATAAFHAAIRASSRYSTDENARLVCSPPRMRLAWPTWLSEVDRISDTEASRGRGGSAGGVALRDQSDGCRPQHSMTKIPLMSDPVLAGMRGQVPTRVSTDSFPYLSPNLEDLRDHRNGQASGMATILC